MAGIGFELKKLFKDKGLLSTIKAYFYSTFVTIGPILISISVITFLQFLLKAMGVEFVEMEILQATIMYSFIFSVIMASGYCMMLSRYLSDRLYFDKIEDVLPSLFGAVSFILMVASIVGIAFYYRSPLNIVYKFFAYLLFIELTIEMILSVYVSALKNFKKVTLSFLYGTITSIITGFILIKNEIFSKTLSVLISFDLCILIVIILLSFEIQKYFRKRSTLYFNFLKYFSDFKLIFFTNLCFTIGLYAHNFAFWIFSDISHTVKNTFIYSPFYDIPSTYAFLSIMPTMVIFVVKVETAFYEKYRNYFYLINNGACYEDIEIAKNEMKKVVFKEILYIMQIQLFFSIIFMILGMKFLPLIGFSANMVDVFNLLVLGYYCVIIMFVIMTIILYFDNRKSAFSITLFFAITSFLFTLITIKLGHGFYGLGFFISGLLSLVVAWIELGRYIKNIDYYVFCIQVSWKEEEDGYLTKLIDKINKIGS